jgi:hypothetical protein
MAKQTKAKGKPRRTTKQIAEAMYRSKPPSRDMARDVQLQSRARGSVSPLGGTAVALNPLLGVAGALAKKGARR